jgi:signal transduction histidine kinase/CheY-like chemotaxis protein
MSEAEAGQLEGRVLLLAPTKKDAAMTERILASIGVRCMPCDSVEMLCAEIERGAGAVVLTEHAIALKAISLLTDVLRRQPPWSDLPIVFLARDGANSAAGRKALQLLENVTVLERPLQIASLASVVRTLIRSRQRQYQIREHLLQRERISRAKDEFLATLSHELRTPLNAILGWSHILASAKTDDEDLAEGLRTIERNARAQTQIIEDLLDMSRIINGKVRLDVQRLELVPILEAAVETVRPSAVLKNIRIQTVLDANAGLISGDPNRLQQVFWNLLSNAIKFTGKGGRIQVLLERVNSHLEVSISDTGEGIDPEFLPHIFDRFRQADSSSTRRHGGLGLGLSIVKQLVELHGGTIFASSAGAGQGSTFTVKLPLTVVQPQPRSESPRRHPKAPPVPQLDEECVKLSGVKVLVVDDEPDARSLVKRLLEDCGAVVVTAGSAGEAFELLQEDPPSVLVSDIGMPGEDGFALIGKVRHLEGDRGGETPAIALTAYARTEDRIQAIRHGFQMHCTKPVEPAELVMMVAALAGRSKEIKVSP